MEATRISPERRLNGLRSALAALQGSPYETDRLIREAITFNRGSVHDVSYDDLRYFSERLPLIQTFLQLLMDAAVTKAGKPVKRPINKTITGEKVKELLAEAYRRHTEAVIAVDSQGGAAVRDRM